MVAIFLLLLLPSFCWADSLMNQSATNSMTIILSMLLGAYVITGISHLSLWIKESTDTVKLLFALLCFLGTGYLFYEFRLHFADSTEEFTFFSKMMVGLITLWWYTFFLFVIAYTKLSINKFFLIGMTIGVLFLTVKNVLSPYSIYYSSVYGLEIEVLPWGESVVKGYGVLSTTRLLLSAYILIITVTTTVFTYKNIRRHGSGFTTVFLFFLPFYCFFVTYLMKLIADMSGRSFIYTTSIAFLFAIILMHIGLTRDYHQVTVRFSHLFNHLYQHIIVIDTGGYISYVNDAALKVTNIASAKLVGTSFFDSPWAADLSLIIEKHKSIEELFNNINAGQVLQYETFIPVYDEKDKTYSRKVYDITLKSGLQFDTISGIIVEAKDASFRMEMEKEVSTSRAKLQSLTVKLSSVEEYEKKKIADYLHDDLGQQLSLLRLRLGMLQSKLNEQGSHEVKSISDQINELIKTLRSYIFEMSPQVLYTQGLSTAVQFLGDNISEVHGFEFILKSSDSFKELDKNLSVFVFRTIQEFLVNSVKYSGADTVRCSLSSDLKNIHIVFEDNGVGFDTKILKNIQIDRGFGLFALREKIEYLGGTLVIDSSPGNGININLVVPLKQENRHV